MRIFSLLQQNHKFLEPENLQELNIVPDIDFDIVKLDMKFLSSESDNRRGGTILSSVVRMAQWLDMPVIAEGVENEKQLHFLMKRGCDMVQGYYFSPPVPAEEFEKKRLAMRTITVKR